MLASGRDKIETPDQFERATATARENDLDGLIVIGGDDSNTNACLLAEHYKAAGLRTSVVGLPKTIDGDLKNSYCETSFGFDTAAKLYAELVGNIMVDSSATRKCTCLACACARLLWTSVLQRRPCGTSTCLLYTSPSPRD